MSTTRVFMILCVVFACFTAACSSSSVSGSLTTDGDWDAESEVSADGDSDADSAGDGETTGDADSTADADTTDGESSDESPALDGDTEEADSDSPTETESETAPDGDSEAESDAESSDADTASCVPDSTSCDETKLYRCDSGGDGQSLVTDCGPVGCAAGACTVEAALACDGSSAYVDFGSTFILYGLDVYTVEAWFVWDGTTDGSKTYQIYSEGYNEYGTLNIYINGKGALSMKEFNQTTGVNHWDNFASGSVTAGVWHHMAAVKNNNVFRLYLDGHSGGTSSTTQSAAAARTPRAMIGREGVGTDGNGLNYFKGVIDEVRLSSTIRYTDDFTPAFHFEADSETVGLWHFNEGTGATAADESVNALSGQFKGTAAWTDEAVWASWACAPAWKSCDSGSNVVQLCNDYGQWTSYQSCEGADVCAVTGTWDAACQ